MTETRVPAGVPTGGQFAASAKAESAVSLAPTDTVTEIGTAGTLADAITAKSARFNDLLACVGEAREIRAQHPAARYAVLVVEERREYDDLGDFETRVFVFDENMDEVGQYVSDRDPLRYGVPDEVADEKWASEWDDNEEPVYYLNVDAAAKVDVADAETRFREEIAGAALMTDRFESYVVTPSVVADKISDVIDDGRVNDLMPGTVLTAAQEAEVIRRVMDDRELEQAFEPTYRRVDALVARHVEDVRFGEETGHRCGYDHDPSCDGCRAAAGDAGGF